MNNIQEPENTQRIAEWLMASVDSLLSSAVSHPIELLAKAIAPLVVVGLSLQFLAYSMSILRGNGNMDITEFFWRAIRVAIIASIATAGGIYQTQIASIMIELPDSVVSIVSGDVSLTEKIDRLTVETGVATKKIESSESRWYPSTKVVLVSIYAGFIGLMSALIGAGVSVIMVVIKLGMALVVATGPIFITALVFDKTEKLFDSWVSQALNFIILALLVGLVMSFFIDLSVSYVTFMIKKIDQGNVSLIQLISGYFMLTVALIVTTVFLPGLAQGLSGGFGAQTGVGAVSRGAFRAIRTAGMLRKLTFRK